MLLLNNVISFIIENYVYYTHLFATTVRCFIKWEIIDCRFVNIMAAIVRVKRRLNEDPVDSLLLSCKRFKSDETVEKENDTGEVKSVFKFAGTLPSKVTDILLFCNILLLSPKIMTINDIRLRQLVLCLADICYSNCNKGKRYNVL